MNDLLAGDEAVRCARVYALRQAGASLNAPSRATGARWLRHLLLRLYDSAACLLFPSRYEGYGLPPVEAMACGCPVLAMPGGAVEEVCDDGALYLDALEPRAIAAALARLLDEDGLADGLRARGRARAASLSWAESARALADVLRQTV